MITMRVCHLEHPTVLLEALEGAVVALNHGIAKTPGALHIIEKGATEHRQRLPPARYNLEVVDVNTKVQLLWVEALRESL